MLTLVWVRWKLGTEQKKFENNCSYNKFLGHSSYPNPHSTQLQQQEAHEPELLFNGILHIKTEFLVESIPIPIPIHFCALVWRKWIPDLIFTYQVNT